MSSVILAPIVFAVDRTFAWLHKPWRDAIRAMDKQPVFSRGTSVKQIEANPGMLHLGDQTVAMKSDANDTVYAHRRRFRVALVPYYASVALGFGSILVIASVTRPLSSETTLEWLGSVTVTLVFKWGFVDPLKVLVLTLISSLAQRCRRSKTKHGQPVAVGADAFLDPETEMASHGSFEVEASQMATRTSSSRDPRRVRVQQVMTRIGKAAAKQEMAVAPGTHELYTQRTVVNGQESNVNDLNVERTLAGWRYEDIDALLISLDKLGGEGISKEETKKHLHSKELALADIAFEMMWKVVDRDNSGTLDADECVCLHFLVNKLQQGMKMGHALRLLKDIMDSDDVMAGDDVVPGDDAMASDDVITSDDVVWI